MHQWKIGILGTGGIAEKMAYTLSRMPEVLLLAAAARDEERARAFAQRFGVPRAYGSYLALAQDPDIDLIYIATPNNYHREHALLCLNNGKHVLCEKPFTMNEAEALEVFAKAAERRLLVTEALWTRYMPLSAQLCRLLKDGAIGEPFLLQASMSALSPLPRLKDPNLGGGALLDIGVYLLTIDALVFGSEVESISTSVIRSAEGIDLQSCLSLLHPGQKLAVLSSTMLAVSDRRAYVYGSKGFLTIDNLNNPEQIEVFDQNRCSTGVYRRPEQISGMEYEVRSCLNAIEYGQMECPEMPHAETLRILRRMDSIRADWGMRYPCEQ
ncbi:Gfo/Idh/MocA family protein [Faecalispora anaeroviscerum]|uniref:Gfo/Idh/MocA family protein n=1 Tax=Faecalispora anaeroviscerum TaxID=2991836 RepID=UPI0024BA42F6|nr:Gfo/Idh/MocA family oxidoreductase [Faecalispora anaeroviscerum]